MDNNTVNNVDNLEVKPHSCADSQNFWLWLGALVIGGVLGMLGIEWINTAANFIATVFTRLFQFIAVPTIALAVTITLATLEHVRTRAEYSAVPLPILCLQL